MSEPPGLPDGPIDVPRILRPSYPETPSDAGPPAGFAHEQSQPSVWRPGHPGPDRPWLRRPDSGSEQPSAPFAAAGHPAFEARADDPLVNHPTAGFDGWFSKLVTTLRRSWRSLLIVVTVGVALPEAPAGIAMDIQRQRFLHQLALHPRPEGLPAGVLADALFGLGVVLALTLVGGFFSAAGWAAGIWALTEEAATGRPAAAGRALRYGLRRAARLWLWGLVAAPIVVAGFVACVLPGIYLALAVSLYSFVVVFERGRNPIGGTFRLTHKFFGAAAGRTAVLVAVCVGYSLVVDVIVGLGGALVALAGADAFLVVGATNLVQSLLQAPATALLLAGLLLTYAELRAREVPLTTADLRSQL